MKVAPSSDTLEQDMLEEVEITVGLVCLLCKRQFASNETLQKHIAMSDLHKVLSSIAYN
jgi:hypothetical protein